MGSSVKKVVKKATTLPRKIIKTVKKNPALLMLAAPYAFPTAFASLSAAGSGAFLQGAAKRALIQALATKAAGGDVSIKDALIGGAVGQGIGQFGGNAAMFKGVNPKLLQAGIGAATNVGTSLARGQKIDPKSALISGGLNYLMTPQGLSTDDAIGYDEQLRIEQGAPDIDIAQEYGSQGLLGPTQATSFRESMGDINLERGVSEFGESRIMPGTGVEEFAAIDGGISPTTPTTLQLGDTRTDLALSLGDVEGYTGDFPLEPNIKITNALGRDSTDGFTNEAAETKALETARGFSATAGEASDFVFDPSGNLRLFSPTNLKNVGNLALQGNLADAAKLTFQLTKDNPFETITALSATAPLFFSPVPQEGESEEDFTQRKVDVTNYLRQYGSNFYSGADLDDFISRATSNFGYSQGGRVEAMGGGIMGLGQMPMGTPRMNQGGVTELDYRAEGGFVPVGIKEKADDVPAMLSKNEFVMTADAVRSAGNGSIEKGAQKMYDTMKQLESRVV
jgi:hypothetical protein